MEEKLIKKISLENKKTSAAASQHTARVQAQVAERQDPQAQTPIGDV